MAFRLSDPVMGIVQVAIIFARHYQNASAGQVVEMEIQNTTVVSLYLLHVGVSLTHFALNVHQMMTLMKCRNISIRPQALKVVETDGSGNNATTIAAIAAVKDTTGGRKAIDAAKSNAIMSAQLTKIDFSMPSSLYTPLLRFLTNTC